MIQATDVMRVIGIIWENQCGYRLPPSRSQALPGPISRGSASSIRGGATSRAAQAEPGGE
ncbi:hypothetical protein QGP82_24695 [Leptothoe sp. LEGE 181152]|nr:hypothetical protein [Leptothoe sp. LEGE 181152]